MQAQQSNSKHTPWSDDTAANRCEVVELPENVFPKAMQRSISLLGEPSLSPKEDVTEQIFDNGKEYVYRLALCLSPYYINEVWRGNLESARNWVKATGEYLNKVYSRDLGIRFDIIEDDRLFLKEYPGNFYEGDFKYFNGTEIINGILGKDKYDVGILIRPKNNGLAGQASLGGAYTLIHKANAMATFNETTIAHELGHMFGAKHPHQTEDGLCIEPGEGQSIMSYGEPRTSFSLASAQSVRRHLKAQPYYPNKDRNPQEIQGPKPGENDNIPYVVESTHTKPELDRSRIRKTYTVTKDTRFQFEVPVKHALESFTYGVQGCDDAIWPFESNALQPVYSLTKSPVVMFQPYYDEGKSEEFAVDGVQVPHSGDYRVGRYAFLMAAADGARYDLEKIHLNIVEGKPFAIKSKKIDWRAFQGSELKLEWEPCTEIYGKDSKVRILLSDDFGQTFKYVLDDQVPNTGVWTGAFPYVNIGNVYHRNFSKPIRGGLIKIEVIGEAAYAVSAEIPGYANPNMLYIGGFILNEPKYIRFKDGPTPFLKLKAGEKIPDMPELEASHKNLGQKTKVQGTEERVGNVIRRKWRATINGTTGTYTQLILIEDPTIVSRTEVEYKAKDLKALADDLYRHKGELGYPVPTLPALQKLDAAYNAVFTAEGKVQPDATVEKINEMRDVLDKISTAKDNEIVKPSDRHYYTLRNYQDMFGRLSYYYLGEKPNPEANNGFSTDASKAIVWRMTEKNGAYSLHDAQGKSVDLESFITPGENETMTLDRGYTWGAFTMVNNITACAQLSQQAKYFSRNEQYRYNPKGYRTNRNGTVSTDFQFVPVEFIEARKPGAERPWNVLENKQQFTLEDNYSDLFVGKAVSIEQLQYTRQFDDTNWQTLYLPFDTDCKDWATHCDVACIDGVQFADTQDGEAVAVYVEMKEGKLLANRPYLIRARSVGKHTFTLNKVTVKPTEEVQAQLAANSHKVCLNGNYGTVSAANLQQNGGFVLTNGTFVQAGSEVPSMRWYLSIAANSGTTLPQSIRLVEKKDAPVGMISIATQEGYGTVFTEKSYVMPDGVTGYRVTQADADSKELKLVQAFEGGETVPAATPLLVKGEKRTYMLYAPNTEAAEGAVTNQENLLLGAATTGTTTAPNGQNTDDFYFYKLYYGDVDNSGVKRLGFYWGAPNGTPFISQANKAYLAVSKSKANRISGFALPGNNTTGITPMENPEKELVVYTITGVRLYPKSIAELKPGVYVVNGQKKIIR